MHGRRQPLRSPPTPHRYSDPLSEVAWGLPQPPRMHRGLASALCGSDSPLPPHGHHDPLAQVAGGLPQPPRMHRRLAGHAAVAVTPPFHRTNKVRPLSAAAPFFPDRRASSTCRPTLAGSLMQPLALPQCNHRVLWSPALDWGRKFFRPPDKGRITQRRECSSGRSARLPPRGKAL